MLAKLLALLGVLAISGTALADDSIPDSEDAVPDETTNGIVPPAVAAARWSRRVIERPLTYPQGLFAAGVEVATNVNSFFDPAVVRVLAGYGITDDFDIAFGAYSFPTSDAGGGELAALLGYSLVRGGEGGKLDVAARIGFGYNLGAEAASPLSLGVQARYMLTDNLAVVTPGGQLEAGLADPQPIAINLPVGLAYQPTPLLYVQLDTNLARLNIKDDANAIIFSDTTPVRLTATYNAAPALDLFGGVFFDASNEPGDTFSILLGGRYYLGL